MPLLSPAQTKHPKVQKRRIRGNAKGGSELAFGNFAIQVLQRGRITAAQLEAARIAINRHLKRKGKMWMRVYPQKPITKKILWRLLTITENYRITTVRLLKILYFLS